jgi:hypothetical protein
MWPLTHVPGIAAARHHVEKVDARVGDIDGDLSWAWAGFTDLPDLRAV